MKEIKAMDKTVDYNTALKAFNKLDLNTELNRLLVVNFSGKIRTYGSNVKYSKDKIEFNLARQWETVNEDVVIGLFQNFFLRIFKIKKSTEYTQTYDYFIKHINKTIKPTKQDKMLKERFDFLNEKLFLGLLPETNLVWSDGIRTLGKFNYHTNTISITKRLIVHEDLLDYVLFHEMCHKKALFYKTKERTMHHTGFFREIENIYPNANELEKKLKMTRL
jgi:hypothetical protein